MKSRLLGSICASAYLLIAMSADAALLSRLDGLAYYDTALEITWLGKTNLAATELSDELVAELIATTPTFPDGHILGNSDFPTFNDGTYLGSMTWWGALAYTAQFNFEGIDNWRLPSMDVNGDGTVVDCSGGGVEGCVDNEMGHLFWEDGISSSTPDPFSNVQSAFYWSSTEFAERPTSEAWQFYFGNGNQVAVVKGVTSFEWVVADGDVFVPIPTALWLFGSGLIGLIGIARRKAA